MQDMKLVYRGVYDQPSHARVAGLTGHGSVLFAEARFRRPNWQSDPGGKQETGPSTLIVSDEAGLYYV